MRNASGAIAECSQSNLFVVSGGIVKTPPLEAGLLPGITRAFVLELCGALGISAIETAIDDQALLAADEAFLTSTTREIVPIVRVDGRPIGGGTPGTTTISLLREFRARIATAV